jgi:hypothetical protein
MKSPIALLLVGVAAWSLTGCVTRGYKPADKNIPPAVSLNLTGTPLAQPAANPPTNGDVAAAMPPAPAVTLHTVIVFQGPGSWKNEAYWDEYVVSVANRTTSPLVVHRATLTSAMSDPLTPGDDPWKLENAGKKWWQTTSAQSASTYLKLGAGTVAGAGIAIAGAFTGGLFGSMTSAGAAAFGAGTAAVVALPLVAIGTVGMNIHRKNQIGAEFDRRRLKLPLTLAPGQTVEGSLFFRITPAPQRLVLHSAAGDQPHDTAIALTPLSGLHLRAPAAAFTASQTTK